MVLLLKNKSYEKTTLVFVLLVFFLILVIIFFIVLHYFMINRYSVINGIVYTDDLILIVVAEDERKTIYHNSYFYIDDKKTKYSINEDKGITLIKNDVDYYELLIKTKINNKYKLNDTLDISIKKKREKIINIFRIIWEDD